MKFADKDFSFYWKFIKVPTYILIGWSVLGFVFAVTSFSLYRTMFPAAVSWILVTSVFVFIGWTSVRGQKQKIRIAAWAGALSGIISGFIGAIIGIAMFYTMPDVLMQQIASTGMDATMAQSVMRIGVYIGLVTGPATNAVIGATLSAIAGLVAKKV